MLTLPTNTPLGTFVKDGLRAGPSYSDATLTNNVSSVKQVGNYNKFGKGILYSPQVTWDIVPYGSTAGNVVSTTAVTGAGYLTFSGDNQAAKNILASDGTRHIEFDWPRTVAIVVAGANMSGPTNVTVFGLDYYGFVMQQTILVQNIGTYGFEANIPSKAFSVITGIYVNGTTGIGGTIAVQTTNKFGLPYVLLEKGMITSFCWNDESMLTQYGTTNLVAGTATVSTPAVRTASPILLSHNALNGTLPANVGNLYISAVVTGTSFTITSTNVADDTTVAWMIPNGSDNILFEADATPASGTTGDTRGLVILPELGETWALPPNGSRRLTFTYYSYGSDNFQQQLALANYPQGAGTVPPLTVASLYGVQQYYTGAPA